MNSIQEIQDVQYQKLIKEHTQSLKDYIIEVSNKAQSEGKPVEDMIDEGLLAAVVGGVVGSTAGNALGQVRFFRILLFLAGVAICRTRIRSRSHIRIRSGSCSRSVGCGFWFR